MWVPCPDTDVKEIKHVSYIHNFILLFCRIYFLYNVKPTFHLNVNRFALGPRIKHDTQCDHFALLIPTCWCPKRPRGPNANPNQPNTSPNASKWNIVRVRHLCSFWWNMGQYGLKQSQIIVRGGGGCIRFRAFLVD